MNSNEFVEYIESLDIKWKDTELNEFVKIVKEIEDINSELYGNIGRNYFNKFMIPEDYVKILKDLKNVRISKFYNALREKKNYLNKLELSEKEYSNIYDDFERELAKKLKLKIYRNRKNQTCIK